MRDTSGWWEPLQKAIIEASPKIAPMSPSSFYQAECGIWLSEFLGVEPKYLWAITSMAQWINVNWTKEQKKAVIIARYYLSDDRHSWRQFFDAYRRSDPDCRLYDLDDANAKITRIDPSSAYTLNRDNFYSNLLSNPPKYRKYDIRSAPKGHYIYKLVSQRGETHYRDLDIPDGWLSLDPKIWTADIAKKLDLSGHQSRKPITINLTELREVANLLDEIEELSLQSKNPLKLGNWASRLKNITLELFDDEGNLITADVLPLEGVVHLPGKVGAGKSTLMILIACWCALNETHISIILSDVASSIKLANDINQRLFMLLDTENKYLSAKISWVEKLRARGKDKPLAAPIIGRTSRSRHLQQLYNDTFEEAAHQDQLLLSTWGWRWLDTNCAIDAYSISEDEFRGPIPAGQEPCIELQNINDGENYYCPLIWGCPLHQGTRDLVHASIWISTPAALAKTKIPFIISTKIMSFYEAIYYHSRLVIVDECDQAQASFDDLLMPSVLLAGPGTGKVLNDLSSRMSRALQKQRSTHDTRSQRWITSLRMADAVTDHIYNTLTSPHIWSIRNWIGKNVFWNMSLMAQISQSLTHAKPGDNSPKLKAIQTRCLDRLAPFVMHPMQPSEWNGDLLLEALGQIANIVTTNSHNSEIEQKCYQWVSQASTWVNQLLREYQVPEDDLEDIDVSQQPDDYWDSLAAKLEFAILTILLDRHISFVETNWEAAPDRLQLAQYDQYTSLRWRRDSFSDTLPVPPTGRLFGFQYTAQNPWNVSEDGSLQQIRFPAMGRWALLQFSEQFLLSDGCYGPHALLLSGTSWSPKSPLYNCNIRPIGIISSKSDGNDRLVEDWYFLPVKDDNNRPVGISGRYGDARRRQIIKASEALVKQDILARVFEHIRGRSEESSVWKDRERILLLTGSYSEALLVAQSIQYSRPDWKDQIYYLKKGEDNSQESEMYLPVEVSHVERGNISKFAKLYPEGKILAAPAGSIGRGINMLNAQNIAAFGAILFIVRSLMPPHDPVNHARSLMHWLQNRVDDNRILSSGFGPAAEELRHKASQKWRELVTETSTWTDMTDENRTALSATVFTQIWQAVGRGIRGGVPVIVAFIDEKWAPKSARRKGGDTEETSLLLSMLSCYQGYLEGDEGSIYDQKLAQALYSEPIEALKNIRGMDISEILE